MRLITIYCNKFVLKAYKFFLLAFCLIFGYSLTGQNVTYQTLYGEAGFNSKTINTSLHVGSVAGGATVSQGIANYTIPIQIPAGTNNIVPSLSIMYQSQGADGLLGLGWNLIGLSGITRNLKSFYHDGFVGPVNNDNNDRFAIDGVRLISTSGSYGSNNTTYSKESEDFSQTISYGVSGSGPSYFRVETKEGVVMEYGNTADSKFMAKNSVDMLLWRLNKIIYKDGNYIDYIYETINNETRIKEIKYTGNNLSVPAILPYNSITFEYKSRDINQKFKTTTYEVDREVSLNSLLTKIVINSDGQRFKSYTLNYANNGVNIFLNEIIETGSDDLSSLNSTIFKYGDQPTQVTNGYLGFASANGNDLISGDFDGDGYSDIMTANRSIVDGKVFHTNFTVYSKTPTDANSNFNFKYSKTLPYNGSINGGGSNFNIFSSDFNGDGRDDIAVPLTSGSLYPFIFEYMKIYINNTDASNATELNIYLPVNAYKSINLDKKFFNYGDFNGDGIRDVLIITTYGVGNSTSRAYIWYGNSGATVFSEISINGTSNFSVNNWETKNINSIDFDGDGKDEVMITKGSFSEIFSFDGPVAKSIKIAGYPTEWHLMFFGDFNGDRKTDMLTRGGLNDVLGAWRVATSTGKEWIEKPFNWFNALPEINQNYQGDKVLVSDFNGDGKADIIHHFNFVSNSIVNAYYSSGNEFSYNTNSNVLVQTTTNVVVGDFNGDGRSDFVNRPSSTGASDILYLNRIGEELLLQKVKNGEGHISEFGYTRMTKLGSHYASTTSLSYPFNIVRIPMYLVTSILKQGLATTTFEYKNAILHRKGKGLIGFSQVREKGPVALNHSQYNHYTLNQTHAVVLLDSIVNVKGVERINKKTITNQIVQQNSGTLQKILWYKMTNVKDENILENTVSEANNSIYDIDGNVTLSAIVQYAKSGNVLTEIGRATTLSEYGIFGSFRKNVPILITNTTKRIGELEFISNTSFTYNSIGQLLTKIDFFNLPKALTHTYAYNTLGNLSGLTMSATGLTPRSTINSYDSKGRFIIYSTNAANQASSATYDQRWAKPLTSTGVDGIKSQFEYDVFGRLKKTYYRKDLTDEFTTTLDYNWSTSLGIYFIQLSHPGKPDVKTYFDNLDRKICQETEGFQGYWIKEAFVYDLYNSVTLTTGSHRPLLSEVGLQTTTIYDDYRRIKTVTNALQTTEFTYSYVAGNSKVTQTLDLPSGQTDQVSSQTTDVSGKIISTTDASGTLDFTYYSSGNTKNVKRGAVIYSSMTYDDYARQTSLIDINSGTTTYEFNAFGELIKENQPSNNNLTLLYNVLGNITSRSGTEGTTTYLYNTSGVKINKLDKITSFTTGYEETFSYDNVYAKLTSKSEKINNITFVTSFTYNKYDDLLTTTYPSSVVVSNEYDINGYLNNIKNGAVTLFTNQGMTPYNNYSKYQYGNGLITDVTYNYTFPTRYYARNSSASLKIQDLNLVWNYGTGNLTSRNDALVNKTETFVYDIMNRLTSAIVGGNPGLTMNYSTDGNMTIKSDAAGIGGLEFLTPKINAISKIQNPVNIPLNNQNITYAVFQRPTQIVEHINSLDMFYSYDYERRLSIFKTNGTTDETRWYVGNYEKQTIGSTNRDIHYVSNGESLIAIIVKEGSTVSNYYVQGDHLGSILAVTNSSMTYVAQQNFDPWGRRRNVTSWAYTSVAASPAWLYRGYTGHEEYLQFNLINMNARLYDPIVGRMLSPDIAVTMPYSTQGYNRYTYANNNPLKYIDPDGNNPIGLIIASAIQVAVNGLNNLINHRNFFDGWLKAAVIGAVTGGISSGIGSIAQAMKAVGYSKATITFVQAGLHGWTSALVTTINGGNTGSGFISGFASSLTSSIVQSLGGTNISIVLGGTLSGGVGAAVSGGNFFEGAVYGLISSNLNHVAHELTAPSTLMAGAYIDGWPPGFDYNGDGVVSWTESGLSAIEIGSFAFDLVTFPSGEGLLLSVGIRTYGKSLALQSGKTAAKGVPKLLNQFNSAESLIQGAGNLTKVKAGMQGFIKGDGASIFKSITQNGKLQANGQYLLDNGMQIGSHLSKSTGDFTIHITPTVGKMIKIRITP